MVKVNPKSLSKNPSMNRKHIRWDFGSSPDSDEMVRYIVVVSGDRLDRKNSLEILTEQLRKYGGAVELIRQSSGKTKGTKFRYDFSVLDSRTAPDMINWNNFNLPKIQDKKLYERIKTGLSVEDYVANLYER